MSAASTSTSTSTATSAADRPLSATPRTTATRARERVLDDRSALHAVLGRALVAHVGLSLPDHPVVLPMAVALDLEGPDEGGTLYLHGSVGSGWLRRIAGATVCVTVTELDGLVLARSAMHHSMNYRCAVVLGAARVVEDADERGRALHRVVDQVVPGRASTLREHTRRELAATLVVAVPLAEASLKVRSGGPVDDPADEDPAVWSGHVPLQTVAGEPVTAPGVSVAAPADVTRRAADLAGPVGASMS